MIKAADGSIYGIDFGRKITFYRILKDGSALTANTPFSVDQNGDIGSFNIAATKENTVIGISQLGNINKYPVKTIAFRITSSGKYEVLASFKLFGTIDQMQLDSNGETILIVNSYTDPNADEDPGGSISILRAGHNGTLKTIRKFLRKANQSNDVANLIRTPDGSVYGALRCGTKDAALFCIAPSGEYRPICMLPMPDDAFDFNVEGIDQNNRRHSFGNHLLREELS